MNNDGSDELIAAAVQRYLLKVARRWAPGIALLAVILTIVAYVPRADNEGGATSLAAGSGPSGSQRTTGVGATPAAGGGSASDSTSNNPLGGAGGSAAGGVAASGTTKGGVSCGPDVRQVTWSNYAAPCVSAFSGDNGGATAPGVTGDKIFVTYRDADSAQGAAVRAVAGSALGGTAEDYIADLQTYFKLFNSQFETYGREVVLVPFKGQGDPLQEAQGQGQAAAQADAATAHDLNAFADVTVNNTQIFGEALADQGIITYGTIYMSQQWYEEHAPYAYSSWPANNRFAEFTGNMVCQRMAGLNAVFSGDALAKGSTRKFGLMVPENPVYAAAGDIIEQKLQACGVPLAKRVNYQLNIASAPQQAASAMAQMQAAQVTTVLCSCDPIGPVFFASAADSQGFHPEWYTLWWGDALGRLPSASQWNHAMAGGGTSPPLVDTEAYRAYKLASDGAEPKPSDLYFNLAYLQALQLFNGIQAAGPNLNPTALAQGWFSLPASDGDIGPWEYGNLSFTPKAAFQVGYWNPDATSAFDNQKGAWLTCGANAWIRYNDAAAFDPAHTQLPCFGQ